MSDVFPNPLSGDPAELQRDGVTYQQTADAIDTAIDHIRALSSGAFSSQAVDALNRSQGDVIKKISRMHERYYMAGGALVTYARALQQAQSDAVRAIGAHGSLSDQAATLQYRLAETTQLAMTPGPDQPIHIAEMSQLTFELQEVQQAQTAALAAWNEAKGAKDAAAKTARIAIHVGDEAGDLDDDLWDSLVALVPLLELIDKIAQEVLKIVSLIMTILAIVFAVLSLLLPILAPVAAALFGYAQIVNLAIAVLALLAFLIGGFHILDLVLVATAVAATFASGLLGDALGEAADAAIEGATDGISDAAGDALGALAKNAITEGLKDATQKACDDLLDLGSSDAKALYDTIGPSANSFLNTEFADTVTSFKDEGKLLGGYVGSDFNEAFTKELHLGEASQAIQDGLGNFVDNGGLGNLDWVSDGADWVQSNALDPLQSLHHDANALATKFTELNPNNLFSHGPGLLPAPDVAGDQLGDAFGSVSQHILSTIPGGSAAVGPLGDKLGDMYGDVQTSAQAQMTRGIQYSSWGHPWHT